jgi:hypothetical protein
MLCSADHAALHPGRFPEKTREREEICDHLGNVWLKLDSTTKGAEHTKEHEMNLRELRVLRGWRDTMFSRAKSIELSRRQPPEDHETARRKVSQGQGGMSDSGI